MPEPMPEALARQVPISEQFIVGFGATAFVGDARAAVERIDDILRILLQDLPATLVRKRIAMSHDRVYFAIAVIRLDGPGRTIADLQRKVESGQKENKAGYEHIAWCDRNAPLATVQFNDPLSAQQWALFKVGVHQPWTGAGSGVRTTVAIVDSGLRRHGNTLPEDLDLALVEAIADCQPADLFPDNVDRDGHGTLLAGTIAAVPHNATGVSSPVPNNNWNISLMPVKFFSPEVPPDAVNAAHAVVHAATHFFDPGTGVNPVRVINASWHVAPGSGGLPTLRAAFMTALDRGCLAVFAAGNNGTNNEVYPYYPANFGAQAPFDGSTLTVLATDRYDGKAFFSNYGPNFVDIGAPGIHVLSTGQYLLPPARYAEYSGTSAAAALVSAGAGLVFALNPDWQPDAVVRHLRASADAIPHLVSVCDGGLRLNLANAVYGPIKVMAPLPGAVVPRAALFNIIWAVAYDNPDFAQVSIDFVAQAGGRVFPIGVTDIAAGVFPGTDMPAGFFAWVPEAGPLPLLPALGRIRITPVGGNFPVMSEAFRVV